MNSNTGTGMNAWHRFLLTVVAGLCLSLALPSTALADPCEKEVVAACVSTSCPAFCEGQEDSAACVATCTPKNRCKIALFGSGDRDDQKALDAQNRAQLMACLEENRADIHADESLGAPILEDDESGPSKAKTADPVEDATNGKVTDRSASSRKWKNLESPTFHALIIGTKKAEPKPKPAPAPKHEPTKAEKKAQKKAAKKLAKQNKPKKVKKPKKAKKPKKPKKKKKKK